MDPEVLSVDIDIALVTAAVLLMLLVLVIGAFVALAKFFKLGIAPWLALLGLGALCVFVLLGLLVAPRATVDSGPPHASHDFGGDIVLQAERTLIVEEDEDLSVGAMLPDTLDSPAPAWVEDGPRQLDGGRSVVIRSGPHARILDGEQALNKELQKAVTAYVNENIAHGKGHDVSVPPERMRDLVVVDEHVETRRHSFGDMHQIYQRLRFGREAHDQLWAWARESVVQQRLRNAGFGLGAVLLSLLTVFGYLRFDDVTEGRYRRRLGWSAAVCGLLVTGTAMLMIIS